MRMTLIFGGGEDMLIIIIIIQFENCYHPI
jgi:hypothetical protein